MAYRHQRGWLKKEKRSRTLTQRSMIQTPKIEHVRPAKAQIAPGRMFRKGTVAATVKD